MENKKHHWLLKYHTEDERKAAIRENHRRWREKNKEKRAEWERRWKEQNPEKVKERNERRHKKLPDMHDPIPLAPIEKMTFNARVKRATPPWLTTTDRAWILQLYATAKTQSILTGVRHTVDHIVPLNSAIVCGLHVPANLEVKTNIENSSKGNRHWPDMPDWVQVGTQRNRTKK